MPVDADPQRLAALFLLKTCEERKITQVALNGTVQDFRGIWRDAMERLQVDNYIIINCILHAYIIHYDKQFEYSYFDKVLLSLSYRKIFTSINLKGL